MKAVSMEARHPFPLKVAHRCDEPAHALLVRTVAYNGSSKFGRLFRSAGVPDNHTVAKVDVATVAHLCGADPDKLRHGTALRVEDGVELLGQKLRSEYFSDMWRKWCPACLAEEPYHRVWWDVTTVTTCPFHGVELVDRCDCDRPLRHGQHAMSQCRLGHDLTKVTAVPSAGTDVDRYTVHRLLGTGQHPYALLDQVSLGRALHVVERIGRSAIAESMSVDRARRTVGIGALMRSGYQALENFPHGFRSLLDDLVSKRSERDKTSTFRTYGILLRWLSAGRDFDGDCPLASELKLEIERHAERNFIVPNRVLVDGKPTTGVPLGALASELDMNVELTIRLARTLGYEVVEGHPLGNLMPNSLVSDFVGHVRRLETMKDVMATLSVRRIIVIELAELGHLDYVCRPFDRNNPAKGKRGDRRERRLRDAQWNSWYFEPGTTSTFLSRLHSLVDPDGTTRRSDLVDMYWPTRMFATRATVLKLILEGTLPLRGIDPKRPGMRGLLVSKSEAQALLKRARRDGYPLREAAALTGVTYNQLRTFVNAGLIETSGTGTRLSVTDDGIKEFRRKFIRATEVAEIFGVKDSRLVIRYLREHGITPFECDAELGTTLYFRDVAEPAARSLPPPIVFGSSRERARYQKDKGLAVQATRKSYEVPPDWNKRGSDRSGRKAAAEY